MQNPIEHELQQHTAALRRLARGLVGEPWAEDLVQDTVVQALQTATTPPRSWGAWLGTVLRFLAHKHRRTESRRLRRERACTDGPTLRRPPTMRSSTARRCAA